MTISIQTQLGEYISKIKPILNSIVDKEIENNKYLGDFQVEMLEHFKVLVTAGKGIRGFLTCLGYQVGGGKDTDEIIKVSTFMEIFHTSLLVQDDYMDRDNFRRGIESAHYKFSKNKIVEGLKIPAEHFGASAAVCLSDFGLYLSWKVLLESNFSPELLLKTSKLLSNLTIRLGLGQSLDMTIPSNINAKETDILNVIWIKSGEYTCLLPLQTGFTLSGNENDKLLLQLQEYSKCLGWAFQIQDDILSLFGDPKTTGKPVGNDIREGKNTMLTLFLNKHGTYEQKELLANSLGKSNLTDREFINLQKAFIESGALESVKNKGFEYVKEGTKVVNTMEITEDLKNTMNNLLAFMMERAK